MPQDPRRGDSGHRNPHSVQDSEESAASRRRRSLGDDGTGGTRVTDLLSKHGKPPAGGTGSHRRRAAEPDEEPQPAPEQNGTQHGRGPGQASAAPTYSSNGSVGRGSRPNQYNGHPKTNGSPNGAGGPSAAAPGASTPGAAPMQQATGESSVQQNRYQQPPRHTGWTAPGPGDGEPQQNGSPGPAAQQNPWVAERPPQAGNEQPPPPPRRKQSSAGPGPRPAQSPNGQQGPIPPAPGTAAPDTPAPGNPDRGGQSNAGPQPGQRPNGAQQYDPTRITQALNGGGPPHAPDRGSRRPVPQDPVAPQPSPAGPQTGPWAAQNQQSQPNQPRQQGPSKNGGTAAGAAAAAAAAAAGSATAGPNESAKSDPEATAQYRPVPAPPVNGSSPTVAGRNAPPQQSMAQQPTALDDSQERTALARPVAPPDAEQTAIVAVQPDIQDPYADYDDPYDFYDEYDYDETSYDADEQELGEGERVQDVQEIDATLARFSAVHDEIAQEEAARRKKFGWLFGQRKEPELGTDMPFDFHEGRDGQSRVEWKKKQRKRRSNLIMVAGVAVALIVVVIIGVLLVG